MILIDYNLYTSGVDLVFQNGTTSYVEFNDNTGRPLWRYKANTISNVKHEGIYLGTVNGVNLVLHNHYKFGGTAVIATLSQFKHGKQANWSDKRCINQPLEVIENFLNQVIAGKKYAVTYYNCQTSVNQACTNESKSEDVDKWIKRGFGMVVGAAAFVLGALLLDD